MGMAPTIGPGELGQERRIDLLLHRPPVDAMLRRYCTLVFAKTGSYDGAARRLGIDGERAAEDGARQLLPHPVGRRARRPVLAADHHVAHALLEHPEPSIHGVSRGSGVFPRGDRAWRIICRDVRDGTQR